MEVAPDPKRERIIDSARAVFSEQGFDAAKMDEVARRARVSKGTVYNHFASKEALLVECVVHTMDENRAHVAARVRDSGLPGLTAALSSLIGEVLPEIGEAQALRYQIWSLVTRDAAARSRLFTFFREFYSENERLMLLGLTDGAARGDVRPDMVSEDVATLLLAVFDGLVYRTLFDAERLDSSRLLGTLRRLLGERGENGA